MQSTTSLTSPIWGVENIDPDLMKEFRRRDARNQWESSACDLFSTSTKMLAFLTWLVATGFIFGGLPLASDVAAVVAVPVAISVMTFVAALVTMRKITSEKKPVLQERSRQCRFLLEAYTSAVQRALNKQQVA